MMSSPARIAMLALGLSALAACTQAPAVDTAKEADAIRAQEADWTKEMTLKDAAKQTARYTPDAVLYASGFPVARGTDAIKSAMTEMFKDPAFALSFAPDKVVVAKSGELAYTTGRYTVSYTNPKTKAKVTEQGVYVTDYQKQADGRWLASVDFAGALPPAAPPA